MTESFERVPSGNSPDLSGLQRKINKAESPESHADINDETTRELLQTVDILRVLEDDLIVGSSEVPWLKIRRARQHIDELLKKHLSEQEKES